MKFGLSNHDNGGASKLALMLEKLSLRNCDITVIGTAACKALVRESNYVSLHNMVENASLMWEFLKGRKLHGLMALDRVCFLYFSTGAELIFLKGGKFNTNVIYKN